MDMDLSGALPDKVILEVYDEKWVQTVDYEHIPFKCHRCHEDGHLLRDCPLIKVDNKSKANIMKDTNSFHKVVHKGKGGKKGPKQQQKEEITYFILQDHFFFIIFLKTCHTNCFLSHYDRLGFR